MSEANRGDGPGEARWQRLDKWLWFARLAKSRSLAAGLIASGKIRVNRARAAKASQLVRAGDVITCAAHGRVCVVRVKAYGTRRGPAVEARALYEELTPATAEPKSLDHSHLCAERLTPVAYAGGVRLRGAGRPTKRERRQIDLLKRSDV